MNGIEVEKQLSKSIWHVPDEEKMDTHCTFFGALWCHLIGYSNGATPCVIPLLESEWKSCCRISGFNLNALMNAPFLSPFPPWLLKPPEFIYALRDYGSKSEIPREVLKSNLNEVLSYIDGFQKIYTDGSKAGSAVAAAAICQTQNFSSRVYQTIHSSSQRKIMEVYSRWASESFIETLLAHPLKLHTSRMLYIHERLQPINDIASRAIKWWISSKRQDNNENVSVEEANAVSFWINKVVECDALKSCW